MPPPPNMPVEFSSMDPGWKLITCSGSVPHPKCLIEVEPVEAISIKVKQDIAITGGGCQSPRFSPGATWAGTKRPIPPIHQMKGSPCVFVNVQGVKKVVFHLFFKIFISQETTINPWGNSFNFMLSCWGNYSCNLTCCSASVDKGFGIFPYSLTLCINPLLQYASFWRWNRL